MKTTLKTKNQTDMGITTEANLRGCIRKAKKYLECGDPVEAVSALELAMRLPMPDDVWRTIKNAKEEAESGSPEKAEHLIDSLLLGYPREQKPFQHTRGPWIYKHDKDGTRISPKWGQFQLASLESCDDAEREANARLMTAAPELLEACEQGLSALLCQKTTDDGFTVHTKAIKQLRRAIAKAT